MADAITGRTTGLARNAAPGLITLSLMLLSLTPLGVPGSVTVMPPLAMMGVYYWSIYRPDLLPGIAAFAIGLLQDFLGGGPIGLHAIVFLCIHWLVGSQQRFFLGKTFVVEWWSFMLVASGAFAVMWLIASLYLGILVSALPLALQALLTVLLYPALNWALGAATRIMNRL